MAEKNYVQHQGVITGISAQTLEVTIEAQSACAACHAKRACGMAEKKQKIITAKRPEGNFQVGDSVTVYAETGNAVYAVIIAYVMPSVLIIATIFFLEKSGNDELSAAITALILLVTYFLVLYLFRNKIGKKIKFTLQKNDNY